ncbi:hypothetical protein DSLASN_42220 [Desulfoluna limicola]|uniref:Uncharacterized protein n=1 Tax=Desulfoluna limicola TaxID=2810562 RepID=A0ABM7PN19_9BACT|nr:hypothetical protein DSLASN_42220 [Desulfoluna limicola]
MTNGSCIRVKKILAYAFDPRNEGREHGQPGGQGIIPWLPEARLFLFFLAPFACRGYVSWNERGPCP